MARVVILGSGFAGMTAAFQLRRKFRRGSHQITVIARDAHFLYRPSLVHVAFGKKSLEDISVPLAPLYAEAGIEFLQSEVVDIDPEAHTVSTQDKLIYYDKLIVALGERLAFEEIPGLREYGHTVCTAEGAMRLRQALDEFGGGPAVVGWAQNVQTGGPAFEVALELNERMEKQLLLGSITFVDPLPKLWAPAGEKATQLLSQVFQERRITRLGPVQIQSVHRDHVVLADGREIPSVLTIVTPPFRGEPAQKRLAQNHPRDWLETGRDMRAIHHPDIYVAGSAVAFEGPKQGHTAMLQAEVAAHNLALDLTGSAAPRREYDHEMSCVLDLGNGQGLFVRRSLWNARHQTMKLGRQWPWAKAALEYAFVNTPVFNKWAVPMSKISL